MDEITISLDDSPMISQPSPVLIGDQPPVVVQENFVGGRSATIQIGSVETLPAGSEAYVQNVGTETDAVFNFGIPEGERGLSGSDGVDGSDGQAATITVGTVSTGLPDTNASVTNVGTSSDAVLDFTIPRGSQGERGLQGVAGEDGVSPIAYVTQTSTGATIHIEDAQNVTDAVITNGTDGTDGTDGFSPIATVTQNTGSATITITDANGTTTATVYDGSDAPVPNDGTLTIQKNGTTVQTFTANQSSNATANITVPTQFSDLTGTIATSEITNNAVTPAKLSDTGWILADQYVNTAYFSPRTHIYYRILAGVVYWSGAIYCHTAPNSQSADLMTGLPNDLMPRDEATFYGDQFYVSNSSYQIWTENNGFKVLEYNQNIPATYDYQGYTLTQIQYISGSI